MNKKKTRALIVCVILRFGCIFGLFHAFPFNKSLDRFDFIENDIQQDKLGRTALARFIRLREGNYSLSTQYSAEVDQTVYVVEEMSYDSTSEMGKTIAAFTLPAGESLSSADSFEIDGFSKLVSVFVVPAEEGNTATFAGSRIESIGNVYTDTASLRLFVAVTVILIRAVFILQIVKDEDGFVEIVVSLAGILIICFLSNWFYLKDTIVYGNDIRFHINRVEGICQSILAHDIPQRLNMAYNAGYGYANPLFYPELFLYIPALLMIRGMSIFGALKLFMMLVNIASALISYYCSYRISQSRYTALIACAVYTLANYRMQNVYARFAVGEALFMAFFPLAVYGLYSIFYEEKKKWLLFAVGVSAVLQSHIIGFVLMLITLAFLAVCFALDTIIKKQFELQTVFATLKSIAFVVLANLWFVIPFLYQYYNNFDKFNMFEKDYNIHLFLTHIPSLQGYWSWNLVERNVVFNIGPLVIVGLSLAVLQIIVSIKNMERRSLIALVRLVLIVDIGFICTDKTDWASLAQNEIISSLMVKIQFAFRLNSIILLLLFLIISLTPIIYKKYRLFGLAAAIIALSIGFINTNMFNESIYVRKEDNRKVLTYFRFSVPEYLPKGIDMIDEVLYSPHYVLGEGLNISRLDNEGSAVDIDYSKSNDEESVLKLPRIYYEGYTVTEGSDAAYLRANDAGYMEVVFREGKRNGNIRIEFGKDSLYRVPTAISCVSLPIICIYGLYEMIQSKKKKEA